MLKSWGLSAILLILCNCVSLNETVHGYNFEHKDITSIKEKIHTKEDVITELGTPSIKSNFGQETWFYVNYKNKYYAFFSPNQEENQIMSISFNADDSVDKIFFENNKKLNVAEKIKKATATRGARRNYLIRMLNNLGYQPGL